MSKSKLRGAVWGFIIGDSLGLPYEFIEREHLSLHPITKMAGYGTHNQPIGTWSDDSSMMLCVMENIINKGSVNDLAMLFKQWFLNGYNTPFGEVFDIGITTLQSILKMIDKKKLIDSNVNCEYSAGNGSLMRSLPYAFLPDFSKASFKLISESRITHRLNICNQCNLFYVKMVRSIYEGSSKEKAFNDARAYMNYGKRIVDVIDKDTENKMARIMDSNFPTLDVSEIYSTGYVINTLESCVWCFINSLSYKEAVLKAVNLGGDTDTIAALTGGLAGCYYGIDKLPKKWINSVQAKSKINSLLDAFCNDLYPIKF